MQYAKVPVTGDITFHEAEKIELEHLYEGTGAQTVQAVSMLRDEDEAVAWMDEEYLYHPDKEVNLRADWLIRRFSPGTLIGGRGIGGDVVITGGADDEGETLGLAEAWREYLSDAEKFIAEYQPA